MDSLNILKVQLMETLIEKGFSHGKTSHSTRERNPIKINLNDQDLTLSTVEKGSIKKMIKAINAKIICIDWLNIIAKELCRDRGRYEVFEGSIPEDPQPLEIF